MQAVGENSGRDEEILAEVAKRNKDLYEFERKL